MQKLRQYLQKRQAKKWGLRLHSIKNIASYTNLLVELPASLGESRLSAPGIHGSPTLFGAYSYMRSGELGSVQSVGRYCSLGQNVIIGQHPHNHPLHWVSTSREFLGHYQPPEKYTVIGHDVWIGHNSVIMAGVTIGHGAVVGMNSVVTRDVQPYEVVAGVPARHLRFRFADHIIKALLASQWWQKEYSRIKALDMSDIDGFLTAMAITDDAPAYRTVLLKNKEILFCTPRAYVSFEQTSCSTQL